MRLSLINKTVLWRIALFSLLFVSRKVSTFSHKKLYAVIDTIPYKDCYVTANARTLSTHVRLNLCIEKAWYLQFLLQLKETFEMLNANFMNENNTNSCKYMYSTCIFWKILNLKLNMKKKLQISYRYNGKCVVPNFIVIYYIFFI